MPEILLRSPGRACVIRLGRSFARPELSADRIPADRFVIADRRARAIALPWITGGRVLWLTGGEAVKRMETVVRIVRALLRSGHERRKPVVVVGGGSVCDVGAFAAAIYKRGVPCHLVPTTLLAQVDAAIGGKCGVDLPEGKNLLGAIRQPETVLIDPLLLADLPEREYTTGLAEVVKYGMVADAELYEHLRGRMADVRRREPSVLSEILARCVMAKVRIVERDEQELGERELLNYGHTFGHALEAASGYRLSHGHAISAGMEAAAFLAWKTGLAPVELLRDQHGLLAALGLPTRVQGIRAAAVEKALRHDKKRAGGALRFVLPEAVGKARLGVAVDESLVREAMKTILGP